MQLLGSQAALVAFVCIVAYLKKKNVLPLYLVVVTSCDKKYNFEVSCWDMIGHLGCG